MLTMAERGDGDGGDAMRDLVLTKRSAAEWHADLIANGMLPFWVVFYNTATYPDLFIARAYATPAHGNGGLTEQQESTGILIAETLATIRGLLPYGLDRVGATINDDRTVVERWIS